MIKSIPLKIHEHGFGKSVEIWVRTNEDGYNIAYYLTRELAEKECKENEYVLNIPLWIE